MSIVAFIPASAPTPPPLPLVAPPAVGLPPVAAVRLRRFSSFFAPASLRPAALSPPPPLCAPLFLTDAAAPAREAAEEEEVVEAMREEEPELACDELLDCTLACSLACDELVACDVLCEIACGIMSSACANSWFPLRTSRRPTDRRARQSNASHLSTSSTAPPHNSPTWR